MIQSISNYLLYKLMGWKKNTTIPIPAKCIICIAPHTSNWDFVIGLLFSRAQGFKANFLMKKEWFFWPLGIWMRSLSGIPVNRGKKSSLTDQLAETASQCKEFRLAITPEGTRKRVEEWKKGFYFIALKAQIPILLFGVDYKNKTVICTKEIIPDGNVDSQMLEIKSYYQNMVGKITKNFTTG